MQKVKKKINLRKTDNKRVLISTWGRCGERRLERGQLMKIAKISDKNNKFKRCKA
jgi:hypothetical protein